MVQPSQTPMDDSGSATELAPAPPAKPRLTFGISTLKDVAPAPAPAKPATRPIATSTRQRPAARSAPATNSAPVGPAAAVGEAALRVAITERMAHMAQETLTELQRQHPTIAVPAIDRERVDGAAAQALADPAFATRLRLLVLGAAPVPVAEDAPPSVDVADPPSGHAADATTGRMPEPEDLQAADETDTHEGDAVVDE